MAAIARLGRLTQIGANIGQTGQYWYRQYWSVLVSVSIGIAQTVSDPIADPGIQLGSVVVYFIEKNTRQLVIKSFISPPQYFQP